MWLFLNTFYIIFLTLYFIMTIYCFCNKRKWYIYGKRQDIFRIKKVESIHRIWTNQITVTVYHTWHAFIDWAVLCKEIYWMTSMFHSALIAFYFSSFSRDFVLFTGPSPYFVLRDCSIMLGHMALYWIIASCQII